MSQNDKPALINYMDNIAKLDGRFRFCTFQTYDGQRRHYICGHHEYCCTLGCCVSTAFSFYQLWYFWLLILLIILLCSGGGWWFRWRHGNFGQRSATPSQGRRRHGRNHGNRNGRVYPNGYYPGGNGCNLPPGYDKDPPSYNEVISHLSQFPRADTRYIGGESTDGNGGTLPNPTAQDLNQLLAVPPPSYQMVLDLKRRETEGNNETAEADRVDRVQNTRSRIQTLLGRAKRKCLPQQNSNNQQNSSQAQPPPPPVGSFPSAPPLPAPSSPSSSSLTSDSTRSSGLFTISRESLPSLDVYARHQNPPGIQRQALAQETIQNRAITSPTESGSHSDYSSSFLSTPSSVSRSSSVSSTPRASPPSYEDTVPPTIIQTSPEEERRDDLLEVGVEVNPRPCTGRSTLSRPTTSISTRSMPIPDEIPRNPSLPGALQESEVEEEEEEKEEEVTTNNTNTNNNTNTTNNSNSMLTCTLPPIVLNNSTINSNDTDSNNTD